MKLANLLNKNYAVPKLNTRYFEPTLAERQKLLKRDKSFYIVKTGIKPHTRSAVGANLTQKPPVK